MTTFRFSPRPNRAAEINWQEWSPEAFAAARQSDKPVLLNLTAVWCHWCHVMDETSYSDPEIIAMLNENFITVRVDADQNPHIQDRYLDGGWPTNAFLTPEGEVLLSGTYIPPAEMKLYIKSVLKSWREDRARIQDHLAAETERMQWARARAELNARAAGDKEEEGLGEGLGLRAEEVSSTILKAIRASYDKTNGGFGRAPKFPHPETIEFLLDSYLTSQDQEILAIVTNTLDHMIAGEIWDVVEGGFFRYATKSDWSTPHYEKMLSGNAGLLNNLVMAWQVTGNPQYKEIAERIIQYVITTLSVGGSDAVGAPGTPGDASPHLHGFAGSQDADEQYFQADATRRRSLQRPYIDDTIHANWNGQFCQALINAALAFGDLSLAEKAMTVLRWLAENMIALSGAVFHYFREGKRSTLQGFLEDQAAIGAAFLAAFEISGDRRFLASAKKCAVFMTDALEDDQYGAFYDTIPDPEAIGALSQREKPFTANVAAARFLIRLAGHLADDWYLREARRALQWFAATYHHWGYQAAAYGLACKELEAQPVRVAIIGKTPTERLPFLAAARMRSTGVQGAQSVITHPLNPAEESEWGDQRFPDQPLPAAYICRQGACQGPLLSPEAVAEQLRANLS